MNFHSLTVLKIQQTQIIVPGLRGPASGRCKSEDITGWGFMASKQHSQAPIYAMLLKLHIHSTVQLLKLGTG